MSPAPVLPEHLQRAFDMARRPDWPATLPELLAAARQAALVQGLAQRLANGLGMTLPNDPTELADTPAAAPMPLRAWDYPARLTGTRADGQTERRRRDTGVDLKRLAAGDSDD